MARNFLVNTEKSRNVLFPHNYISNRNVYTHTPKFRIVYSSIILKNPKLESTSMSINSRIDSYLLQDINMIELNRAMEMHEPSLHSTTQMVLTHVALSQRCQTYKNTLWFHWSNTQKSTRLVEDFTSRDNAHLWQGKWGRQQRRGKQNKQWASEWHSLCSPV